jgi:hypothetical protein
MFKLLLLLISFNAFAVDYTITLKADDNPNKSYNLGLKTGENYNIIQTKTITGDIVKFTLTDKSPKGFYKITSGVVDLDLIFNHQNIVINTRAQKALIHAKVIKDKQNRDYFDLLLSRTNEEARGFVVKLLNFYPENSMFYRTLKNQNNYLFDNSFEKTKQKITTQNKSYNKLLVRKLKDDDNFKELRKSFKDKSIALSELFADFVIDDFAVHSNMTSKRINFYLLKAYLKNKDDKKAQKQNVFKAKDEVLEFFKNHKYHLQIKQIIDNILKNADL